MQQSQLRGQEGNVCQFDIVRNYDRGSLPLFLYPKFASLISASNEVHHQHLRNVQFFVCQIVCVKLFLCQILVFVCLPCCKSMKNERQRESVVCLQNGYKLVEGVLYPSSCVEMLVIKAW